MKMAEDRGCTLFDLTVADLKSINPLFGDDVVQVRGMECGADGWQQAAEPADDLCVNLGLMPCRSLLPGSGVGLQPLCRDA